MDRKNSPKGWMIHFCYVDDGESSQVRMGSESHKYFYFMELENAEKFKRETEYEWLYEFHEDCDYGILEDVEEKLDKMWKNMEDSDGDVDEDTEEFKKYNSTYEKFKKRNKKQFYKELDKRKLENPSYIPFLVEKICDEEKIENENILCYIEKIRFMDILQKTPPRKFKLINALYRALITRFMFFPKAN